MTIVTISRGSFSGGVAVARLVSERLCVPCISREEVRDAAHAADGAQESPGATLDEAERAHQQRKGTAEGSRIDLRNWGLKKCIIERR